MAFSHPNSGKLRFQHSCNYTTDIPEFTSEAKVEVDGSEFVLSAKDLKKNNKLGKGQYGTVYSAVHIPTNRLFAVKYMAHHNQGTSWKRDVNVGVISKCSSVISCYCGLWYKEEVLLVMELMDISLDKLIDSRVPVIPEDALAYTTHSVVTGLEYLHAELRVIHRDVKPSNILANKHGQVKVCDFGISGFLVNSFASTNVGTNRYLAPERICSVDPTGYNIRSDVWSLGLTVLELATRELTRLPADTFEKINWIVNRPAPTLPEASPYSHKLRSFIDLCLVKEMKDRADYIKLLDSEFLSNLGCVEGAAALKKFITPILNDSLQSV